jgi:hypothetical protein
MIVLEVRPVPHRQGRRRWCGREVVQRLGRYLTDGKAGDKVKKDDVLLPKRRPVESRGHMLPGRLGQYLADQKDDRGEERMRKMMSCYPCNAGWSRQGHFLEGSAITSPTRDDRGAGVQRQALLK